MTNQIEIIPADQREVELLEKNRKINLQKLFTPEGMDLIISEIKEEVSDFSADVSTKEGRAAIKSMAAKVAKCKSPIEKLAKEAKDESQKIIAGIQTEWKRYESEMDALRDEIRKPVDEIEEKEAAELKIRQDLIAKIESYKIEGHSPTWDFDVVERFYLGRKKELLDLVNFDWGVFDFKAKTLISETTTILWEKFLAAEKYFKDQAELARLKREAAERTQKDIEEKIAREAAEKARIEADERAEKESKRKIAEHEAQLAAEEARRIQIQQDKERAESEKIAAENRAKEAEKKAKEDARIAEEKAVVEKRKSQLLELRLYQSPVDGNFVLLGDDNEIEVKPFQFLAKVSDDVWNGLLEQISGQVGEVLKKREKARLQKIEDDKQKAAAAAIEAERKRVEEEERKEREATEKREANKRHRAKINNEINAALKHKSCQCGAEINFYELIEAIAKGEVPHVQINY